MGICQSLQLPVYPSLESCLNDGIVMIYSHWANDLFMKILELISLLVVDLPLSYDSSPSKMPFMSGKKMEYERILVILLWINNLPLNLRFFVIYPPTSPHLLWCCRDTRRHEEIIRYQVSDAVDRYNGALLAHRYAGLQASLRYHWDDGL